MVSKIDDQQLEDGLYKKERDLTLRLSTLDAILIAFFLQVISGPIFTKFWLKAGADQTTIGVVTSLLWGMQIFSPLTSTLAHFFKSRKFLAGFTAIIGRICILITVCIGFLKPENPPLALMIVTFAVGCFWLAINNAAWPVLMVEVIPPKIQARYLMWRTGIMTIAGTVLVIISSIFLDNQGDTLQNIGKVLLISLIGGLSGGISLFFHKEPRIPIEKVSVGTAYTRPFGKIDFRKFLYYVFFVNFAIAMMIPIQNTYFFNVLNMDLTGTSVYFVLVSLMTFFLGNVVSRYVEKAGTKPILQLSTWIVGIFMPMFFILSTPGTPWLVYLAAPCEAFVLGIISPCVYCLAMKTSPTENRIVYMTMFVGAIGLGAGLGAVVSGPLFYLLSSIKFSFLGGEWGSHHSMFLLVSILRISTLRILNTIFEENAWSVKQTVKYVLVTVFRRRKSDLNE